MMWTRVCVSGPWSSVSTCATEWSSTSSSLPPTHLGECHTERVTNTDTRFFKKSPRVDPCSVSFLSRLNLRELGPLAAHMRWFVWLMAAAGTIYVFNYHEK